MIPQTQDPQTIPAPALALVAGWLTFRGLIWWCTGFGLLDSPLLLSTPLLDGLVGFMCFALARQLWMGTPGSLPPAILILLMHTTLHFYLLIYLRPEIWLALNAWTKIQVLIESGTSAAMVLVLLFIRPLRQVPKPPE